MNKTLGAVALAVICAAGCTSYYKVTDPTTGKVYYTTELQQKGNGSATLKDARTGNKVNIQNSEIDQVTKEEFEAGKFATPPEESKKPETNPFK